MPIWRSPISAATRKTIACSWSRCPRRCGFANLKFRLRPPGWNVFLCSLVIRWAPPCRSWAAWPATSSAICSTRWRCRCRPTIRRRRPPIRRPKPPPQLRPQPTLPPRPDPPRKQPPRRPPRVRTTSSFGFWQIRVVQVANNETCLNRLITLKAPLSVIVLDHQKKWIVRTIEILLLGSKKLNLGNQTR